MTSKRITVFAVVLGCLLMASPIVVQAKGPSNAAAEDEFDRGYEAARRGYWQEANFRYRRANELQPGNPEILSNLAVSYEAIGRWEEARNAYEEALSVAPNNRSIKKNFRLFEDFAETYVKKGKDDRTEEPKAAGEGG